MSSLVYKKPVTAAQRQTCLVSKFAITKIKILKNKSCFFKNHAGRNNQGRITVNAKGGGHKKI